MAHGLRRAINRPGREVMAPGVRLLVTLHLHYGYNVSSFMQSSNQVGAMVTTTLRIVPLQTTQIINSLKDMPGR